MTVLWSVMKATWERTSYGCKCVAFNEYSAFTFFSKLFLSYLLKFAVKTNFAKLKYSKGCRSLIA